MRGYIALSLVLVAITSGRAADEAPAPAAATAPAETSISAAKRDFDTLKAAREEALHPKSDPPRMVRRPCESPISRGPRMTTVTSSS
jgi:hypothetical protein